MFFSAAFCYFGCFRRNETWDWIVQQAQQNSKIAYIKGYNFRNETGSIIIEQKKI